VSRQQDFSDRQCFFHVRASSFARPGFWRTSVADQSTSSQSTSILQSTVQSTQGQQLRKQAWAFVPCVSRLRVLLQPSGGRTALEVHCAARNHLQVARGWVWTAGRGGMGAGTARV